LTSVTSRLRIVAVVPLDVQFPLDGEELLEKTSRC
jgi:hypothetical protein